MFCRCTGRWERRRYNAKQVPPQYRDVLEVDEPTMTYWPHIWFNDFWMLKEKMVRGSLVCRMK